MSIQTIAWVAWVKDGYVTHLEAGPFVDDDQARAKADELNKDDRWQRYTVVYSDVEVRRSRYGE